jgi:spore germination protein GerM
VQRLIDGPTGRLRSSGASSPFPLGTTLKPVADARDGVQVLDFAGAFVTADAQTRSRIAAQLV